MMASNALAKHCCPRNFVWLLLHRYLASHGVHHIELLGRSGHVTGQAWRDMSGLLRGDWGACVTVTRCDTASADEMLHGIAGPHGVRAGAL